MDVLRREFVYIWYYFFNPPCPGGADAKPEVFCVV